jgi:predicted DNA-binding transcriptional regulator
MTEFKLNPREKMIYDLIVEDLKSKNATYSTLTNNEIATTLQISPFTIRDKVLKMVKRGFIKSQTNFWKDKNTYHQRILFI